MTMMIELRIEHRHGANAALHRTSDEAMRELAEWVAQWWAEELDDPMWEDGDKPAADDIVYTTTSRGEAVTADVIDAYFEKVRGESYTLEETTAPADTIMIDPSLTRWADTIRPTGDAEVFYSADGRGAVCVSTGTPATVLGRVSVGAASSATNITAEGSTPVA